MWNQVMVLWVVMPCSDVVGDQHFGGPCCLHLHPEDVGSTVCILPHHNPEDYDWKIITVYAEVSLLLLLPLPED